MSGNQKILYIVDTLEYVEENCFQQQLLAAFRKQYPDMDILPFYPKMLWPLRSRLYKPAKYTKIISVMRMRNLYQQWPKLKSWLNGAPITIYDQDPWEGYIDTAPTKGVYEILSSQLNVEKMYVTAPFWANYLQDRGHNASWVRMGMNPVFCDIGPKFDNREVEVGFRGAMHHHRKVVFDAMQSSGVHITVSKERLNYDGYMHYLQQLKFFTHDEFAPWICDGEEICRSTAMWVKSIETAARGAFCLRNFHEEGYAYGIQDVPLITCYEHPREAADIIRRISTMDRDEIFDMQKRSVENIRNRGDWDLAARKIVNGL